MKTTPAKTPTSKSDAGPWGRVAPVQQRTGGIKLLVYGKGKTGKTQLACSFPKPVLIIATEDGTKSVNNVPGVDFLRIALSEEVSTLAEGVGNGVGSCWKGDKKVAQGDGDPYASVCIDTAGGLQDQILKEVLGLDEVPVAKSWGITDRQTWQVVGTQLKERMRHVLDLADKFDKDVVVIAHERNFTEEGDGEILMPTVGAALTPSATNWLNGACDYICQTFIRAETKTETSVMAGKQVSMIKPTGRAQYCLRVGPHATFMTGFRRPRSAKALPDLIVDPTYAKILELIQG